MLFILLWVISALGPLRIFLPHIFQITGYPGTNRNYLVLLQNNAELRATGGFITAFALLEFDHGIPTKLDFQDVYGAIDDHEYIKPPYPLDILLEKNSPTYAGHSFRDANWNPSFPEASEDVLAFFHKTNHAAKIDGVFTLNFSVLEKLVGLYEPIKLNADPQKNILTKINLFESLENTVSDIDHHSLDALANRKNIIQPFASALMRRMIFSPWKWRELSELIAKSLNEKEIMMFFKRHGIQGAMQNLGWDGSFPAPDEKNPFTLLAVNVSNFGGMKSDRYITRDVNYTIEITDKKNEEGKPIVYGDAKITLRHRGDYSTPLSGEYKGYIRVFVPKGTELIASETSTESVTKEYVGWGDPILMKPGEEQTYHYRFELNPDFINLKENQINLYVVKQSGTEKDLYEVVVKAPLGTNLEDPSQNISNEGVWQTHENVAFFKSLLSRDAKLTLKLLPDQLPPRLFWHEFKELNTIEIAFAESMDPDSAEDPLNYEIIDLNKNVPEFTDTVTIDYIVVDGGRIEIHTRGIDVQPEEFFQIKMRNLRDSSGNYIRPNPREITVVQRLSK